METLLDTLRATLQNRLNPDTHSLAINATDFGDQSAAFSAVFGSGITLASATFNAPGSPLVISGTCGVWQLNATTSVTLTILEEEAGKLQFTMQAATPSGWKFSDSFASLAGTYFDNLELSSVSLFATSYTHELSEPAITLQPGINFNGTAQASGALASLKDLNQSITAILLSGTIASADDDWAVNLHGAVTQTIQLSTSAAQLVLKNEPGETTTQTADITAELTQGASKFVLDLAIPVKPDALDALEHLLRERLKTPPLQILKTDFSEPVQPDFEAAVWQDTVSLTAAAIVRTDRKTLTVTGKSAVYGQPADQDITLTVEERSEGVLDFTLRATLAQGLNFPSVVPQTAGSFFEDITWETPVFIGTSFGQEILYGDGTYTIAKGANFISKVPVSSGPMVIMPQLGSAFNNLIVAGPVVKSGDNFTVQLTYACTVPFTLQPLGMSDLQMAAPGILTFFHGPDPEQAGQFLDTSTIAGSIRSGSLSFPGLLHIPLSRQDSDWVITLNETQLPLDKLSSLLQLSTGQPLSTYFPPSLLDLVQTELTQFTGVFQLAAQKSSQVAWKVGLPAPNTWNILTTPAVNVSDLQFGMQLTYADFSPTPTLAVTCIVEGKIHIGSLQNVLIRLYIPFEGDWVLQILPDNLQLPQLSDLAQLAWPGSNHTESSFLDALPSGLVNGPQVTLDEIKVGFNPFPETAGLSFTSFNLTQQNDWVLIKDVLKVYGWTVFMNLDIRNNYLITGKLQGFAKISTVADISVLVDIKEGETTVGMALKEGTTISFSSITDLLALATGAGNPTGLPQGIQGLANLNISQLYVDLTPSRAGNPVDQFGFNISQSAAWTVIDSWLTLEQIEATFIISRKEDGGYQNRGDISGIVTVKDLKVWLYAGKDEFDGDWKFKLATQEELQLPTLQDLAQWMMNDKMAAYVPWDFMPFPDGFNLTKLDLSFNLSTSQLEYIDFALRNRAAWNAIPGYISLDNTVLTAKATVNSANPSESDVAVHIGSDLTVGPATLVFTADYTSVAPNWTFTASLKEAVTFSFNELLTAVHLDRYFTIPDTIGLPQLTVQSLNGTMIPQTGQFTFDGTIAVLPADPASGTTPDWTLSFIGLQFKMFGISAKAEIKQLTPEDPEQKNYYKASVSSVLDFNTLRVSAALQLGSPGTDTVFTGTLAASELSQLKIDQLGDALIANQGAATPENPYPDNNQWSKLVPNDMTMVDYASAFVYLNQTKGTLFLYGGITGLGSAILLSQKTGKADERGYIFSFALQGEEVRLANLFPALQVVDDFLKIKNAGITVTSYTLPSASGLFDQLKTIVDTTDKPGTITLPVQQQNLPSGPVEQGVHLYGQLQLTGPLFSVFHQLDGGNTEGLDVTLYAFFSTDPEPAKGSASTVFKAIFSEFSILDQLVTFKGIDQQGILMEYKQSATPEFSLSGLVGIVVFSKTYSFTGKLVINNDSTRFTVSTPPAPTSPPLQLFPESLPSLFQLEKLDLDVIYYFQTEQRAEKYLELHVKGDITLLGFPLSTDLVLLKGKPVLALVTLTQDVSISKLLQPLADTTNPWPRELFDITFKADKPEHHSRIYYYDPAADTTPSKINVNGANYKPGYNLEAEVELTFLYPVNFRLGVNIEKGVGMEAKVGLVDPISIFVLELAGTDRSDTGNKKYINGPEFQINTKTGTTKSQLSTGINFFEYPFGTASIEIGQKALGGDKSETKIGGKLTAAQSVPVFGNLSVDFTYCRSEGFRVQNWPSFTQAYGELIDIAKEINDIMDAASVTGCDEVVNLIANAAYENKFTMTPSFSTGKNDQGEDALSFDLEGVFKVFVAGSEAVSISFPKALSIGLPKGVSFNDLDELIKGAIKDSAKSLVEGIIKNREQFARLAGILFTEQAVALAAKLFCQALIDGITAEAMAAAAEAFAAAAGAGIAAAILAAAGAAAGIFSSCFIAGTEVVLADGAVRLIEDIQIGDHLLGYNGVTNEVLAYDHPKLGSRKLYAFNDGPFFVTAEHPFLTESGWKAIDPAATLRENPELRVTKLAPGDILLMDGGETLELEEIRETDAEAETQLYNFKLTGNNTYIANGLFAHNKGSSCFIAGTLVLMADGTQKAIELVKMGDQLAGKDGSVNTVLGFDHPLLGNRTLYSLNGSKPFVTAEHPFFTTEGWKAIDPAATVRENPTLTVQPLLAGDLLVLSDGSTEELVLVSETTAGPLTQLYNFVLDGNNTYFANDYLVHNKGGGSSGGGSGSDNSPQQPTFASPALTFSGETLTAHWNGADNAVNYVAEFYDPQNTLIGTSAKLSFRDFNYGMKIPLNFNGGNYTARVSSRRANQQSAWTSATIAKLADPASVQLSYDPASDDLSVSWNGPANAQFKVEIYEVANPANSSAQVVAASPYVRKGASLAAGDWKARVTTVPTGTEAVPSQAIDSSNSLTKLQPVNGITIQANGSQLAINWQDNQQYIGHYLVEVVHENGTITRDEYAAGILQTQFDSMGYPVEALTVRITAVGNGSQSITAGPASATGVSKLGKTAQVTLSWDNTLRKLTASWTAVENAKHYTIQVKDQAGFTAYSLENSDPAILSLDIPVSELNGTGTVMHLCITATGDAQFLNGDEVQSPGEVTITRLTLEELAALFHTQGKTAIDAGAGLLQAFPQTGFMEFVLALAKAGYLAEETAGAMKESFPGLTPGQVASALTAAYGTTTPDELALQSKQQGMSAVQTGQQLVKNFAGIQPVNFAVALAKAGYDASETAAAMKESLPGLTAAQVASALTAAYGTTTPGSVAKQFHDQGKSAVETGDQLVKVFPGIEPADFATALAKAGYPVQETAGAMKVSLPGLTAQRVANALQRAYSNQQ